MPPDAAHPARARPAVGAGRLVALIAVGVLVRAPAAPAQPGPIDPAFWSFPRGSVAWVAMDARVFAAAGTPDPIGVLIAAGTDRAAFALPPWPQGSLATTRRLLGALTRGTRPWRVCLMEIETNPAHPPRQTNPEIRPTRLAAAIEVRAPEGEHEQLRGVVRGALGLAPAAGLDEVEIQPSPDGGDGAVAWSPVACRSLGDAFVVALGPGAMSRWLGARDDAAAAWDRHAAAMGGGAGRPVLEAFVDLNALRRAMPDAFGNTPLRRTLRACGLVNARETMLRVRLVDAHDVTLANEGGAGAGGDAGAYTGAPLLAIDASWSSRTEPPETVRAMAIASGQWPANAPGLEPRPGRYALALHPDWIRWTRLTLGVYLGAGDDWDETTRTTRISRWERLNAEAFGRIVRSSGPWAIAWAPEGEAALMFAAPYAGDARVQADQRIIFGSIDDAVMYDERARAWTVEFPSPGLRLRWTSAGESGRRAMIGEVRSP